MRRLYGKACLLIPPPFDRKLGDVASSLTSLTQNPGKEGRKHQINGIVWKGSGQAFNEQGKFIHKCHQRVDKAAAVGFFPHRYWVHCSVGKEWSHHRYRLTLADNANVKSSHRDPAVPLLTVHTGIPYSKAVVTPTVLPDNNV